MTSQLKHFRSLNVHFTASNKGKLANENAAYKINELDCCVCIAGRNNTETAECLVERERERERERQRDREKERERERLNPVYYCTLNI